MISAPHTISDFEEGGPESSCLVNDTCLDPLRSACLLRHFQKKINFPRFRLPTGCTFFSSNQKVSKLLIWGYSRALISAMKRSSQNYQVRNDIPNGYITWIQFTIFLHCTLTLDRIILLHKIVCQTGHLSAPCSRVCSLSHTLCIPATSCYPVHNATQCTKQPVTDFEFDHTLPPCQENCVSFQTSLPRLCYGLCDSSPSLHCSYFSWCDFGGGVLRKSGTR